jgi:Zn-dependent protease with chaperone function/uncharacterized tellurite resistance protein B-like protein
MDFFQSQDEARKKTKLLVLYFAMAVIAIILSIYALLFPAFKYSETRESQGRSGAYEREQVASAKRHGFFQLDWFLLVAGGVSCVILLGSGFKTLSLSSGGGGVARSIGGRRVDPNTSDADERKLMNVIEEMAIASGVPVPEVYVMDEEPSINAFAAGKAYSDAAVGVSRGAIRLLNRDELQGVIAHEFSHILNGDMKLNLRLIGVLHGILILAILGRIILRSAAFSGRSRDDKGAGMIFMALGLGLIIIGYIGVFFGHLIKSAISRQREFLADASAVQFTRNPDGIGGALKKIGGLSYGSQLKNPHAEEVSHMCFGEALPPAFLNSLATHPPLPDRIKAIDKSWDGKFIKPEMPKVSSSMSDDKQSASDAARQDSILQIPGMEGHGPMIGAITAAAAIGSIGQINPENIRNGQRIRGSLPPEWLNAAHNTSGAQALIFSMLLAQDDETRSAEFEELHKTTDETTFKMVTEWQASIAQLESPQKIALIDLSIPALKRLQTDEYERFLKIMRQLIESDGRVDLFEFMLEKIVKRHLDLFFVRKPEPKVRYKAMHQLEAEAAVLISTLANLGSEDPAEIQRAYREGAREIELTLGGELPMADGRDCGLQQIGAALDKFDQAAPMVKKALLTACGKSVMADGKVVSDEAELLRAIADTIGCPIPPFVQEAI